jgi:hypothetical protein
MAVEEFNHRARKGLEAAFGADGTLSTGRGDKK